ncbi:TPA: hypothetical protein ACSRP4_004573, partial [Enterobacter asburiae]
LVAGFCFLSQQLVGLSVVTPPYLSSGPASRWYKMGIMIKPTKDRNGTYYTVGTYRIAQGLRKRPVVLHIRPD